MMPPPDGATRTTAIQGVADGATNAARSDATDAVGQGSAMQGGADAAGIAAPYTPVHPTRKTAKKAKLVAWRGRGTHAAVKKGGASKGAKVGKDVARRVRRCWW
jgi:hypothetical protein